MGQSRKLFGNNTNNNDIGRLPGPSAISSNEHDEAGPFAPEQEATGSSPVGRTQKS